MVEIAADGAEARLLDAALERFGAATRFPVVFGGLVEHDSVLVTAIRGNRGDALVGLEFHAGRGLGGRALVELRPRITPDYGSARTITHDYDRAVLGEGISTLMAMPVIVDGRVRGVLWGGVHADLGIGDLQVGRAAGAAEWLAEQLVASRAGRAAPVEAPTPALASRPLEELRETYAELRSIGAEVDDPGLRARIAAVEERLAAIASGAPAPTGGIARLVRLPATASAITAMPATHGPCAPASAKIRPPAAASQPPTVTSRGRAGQSAQIKASRAWASW